MRNPKTLFTRSKKMLLIARVTVLVLLVSLCVAAPGLRAFYFNNTAVAGTPLQTRNDPNIDFSWNEQHPPVPGINYNYFSVLWLGQIVPKYTGEYGFYTTASDGVRLWVANHLLIDQWRLRSATDDTGVVKINMTAGQSYLFRLEYYTASGQGYSKVAVQWTWKHMDRVVIEPGHFTDELTPAQKQQEELRNNMAKGWNTWYNHNMLAHVLLPDSIAFGWGVADMSSPLRYVIDAHVLCDGNVHPGLHSPDGSYTEIKSFNLYGIQIHSESATIDGDFVLRLTPVGNIPSTLRIIIYTSALWDRIGAFKTLNNTISATSIGFSTATAYINSNPTGETIPKFERTHLILPVGKNGVSLSTGKPRTSDQISTILSTARQNLLSTMAKFGDLAELFESMHTVITWNTIFHPLEGVVTPVTRGWDFGAGYVLFDWDNYFAGMMAAFVDKGISYLNILRITQTKEVNGFVPNYTSGTHKSRDRTEPPVGALAAMFVYKIYQEKWFLEAVFDDLMEWNDWFWTKRNLDGLMVWGSDPNEPRGDDWATTKYGAQLESGLDNSPMWDDANYDNSTNRLLLWDVGLNAMVVRDCQELIEMATILGRSVQVIDKLKQRREQLINMMNEHLWNDDFGLYLNKHTDSMSLSYRLSPCNFYPLLVKGLVTDEQAVKMMKHLTNETEFCVSKKCPYSLPSIARNDPAFKDNTYWRGRIWAPMNFLVYLGLKEYDHIPDVKNARHVLCDQSKSLLLYNWRKYGHIQENYNALTGEGCDVVNADPFYHWGALNAMMNLLEQ
jgi:putative isomerase